jgi:hypothetical protein
MTANNVSFLAKEIHYKMDHPPDSPDFPCGLWFFTKLKNALKEQIESNVTSLLRV